MSDRTIEGAQLVVRTVALTAVENERYFCELDAAVGDGDFGYSLARGFSGLLEQWDELECEDASSLLLKSASFLSKRVGGTSGPIWSTAFLRAGLALKGEKAITGPDVVIALRAAIEGVKQRGNADIGDKTLLDAFVPAVDALDAALSGGADAATAIAAAAAEARRSAEATKGMLALLGRASYVGERSRGSVDAGAVAVAVMFAAVETAWRSPHTATGRKEEQT